MAYGTKDLLSKWRKIPNDTDILVTHFPPLNILDLSRMNSKSQGKICTLCQQVHDGHGHLGCKHLRNEVLERVKPKVHVFGHVHECRK
jgi:Icc-related predicted phosphoesterase